MNRQIKAKFLGLLLAPPFVASCNNDATIRGLQKESPSESGETALAGGFGQASPDNSICIETPMGNYIASLYRDVLGRDMWAKDTKQSEINAIQAEIRNILHLKKNRFDIAKHILFKKDPDLSKRNMTLIEKRAKFYASQKYGDTTLKTFPHFGRDGKFCGSVGVNVHWINNDSMPNDREIQMLADTGVSVVRLGLLFKNSADDNDKNKVPDYEQFLEILEKNNLRWLAIIPTLQHPDEAIDDIKKFHGHGIIWEASNEPNNPVYAEDRKPDPLKYAQTANQVGEFLKSNYPNETYMGITGACGPRVLKEEKAITCPDFMNVAFNNGVLKYFDAVSVHQYRQLPPETTGHRTIEQKDGRTFTLNSFSEFQQMINLSAGDKDIPVISGEWGYQGGAKMEDIQANYVARMMLSNALNRVPVSIWYDWQDDQKGEGDDAQSVNFGLLRAGRGLSKKPSYDAMRTLTQMFNGYQFKERLSMAESEFVLRFQNDAGTSRYAVWKAALEDTRTTPSAGAVPKLNIKLQPNTSYKITRLDGTSRDVVSSKADGVVRVEAGEAPIYLTPLQALNQRENDR